MDRSNWGATMELNTWESELLRLSTQNYAAVNSTLFNTYKDVLKQMKIELKEYVDNYENLTFSQRMEAESIFRNAGAIDKILTGKLDTVTDAITAYKIAEAELGYNGVFYTLNGQYNISPEAFSIDQSFVKSVVDKPVSGETFSQRLWGNTTQLAKETTNAIVQMTSQGKGYEYIARQISIATESSYKHAMRVARTEAGRAYSQLHQSGMEDAKAMGINLQKRWSATMDTRTRDWHAELDGKTIPVDEKFVIGNDDGLQPGMFGRPENVVNCRCRCITIIPGLEPTLRRDQTTGNVIGWQSYKEWYKSL
jgi:SPP1 gp7 family putative phage head morphogenesis protein